jgi:hypothetical protein
MRLTSHITPTRKEHTVATKSIKVSVTIKLDIDIEAWAGEYGFDPEDVSGIRQDVKRHVEATVRDQFHDLGVLAR